MAFVCNYLLFIVHVYSVSTKRPVTNIQISQYRMCTNSFIKIEFTLFQFNVQSAIDANQISLLKLISIDFEFLVYNSDLVADWRVSFVCKMPSVCEHSLFTHLPLC